MIARAQIAIACLLGWSLASAPGHATQAAPADAGSYLTLEKEYHTDCIGLYEQVFLDGRFAYYSKGFFKDNYFTKLDVLTGGCSRVAALPASDFDPRAVSEKYLVARDGIYNRYSVYARPEWKRRGTMRLRDGVVAATIAGDRLYLVQGTRVPDLPRYQLFLAVFSLPDLKLEKTVPLEPAQTRPLTLGEDKVLAVGDTFLFSGSKSGQAHLVTYDVMTGKFRQTGFPISSNGTIAHPDGRNEGVLCGHDARLAGERAALLRTSCHSYALFDLASLTSRYTVNLTHQGVFARGFAAGRLLYVLEETPADPKNYSGGERDEVQVLDDATGKVIATPPPLVSDDYTQVFQVGEHLIWAAFDMRARDFRVDVYKMKLLPDPPG
jgi:hypothetical protein